MANDCHALKRTGATLGDAACKLLHFFVRDQPGDDVRFGIDGIVSRVVVVQIHVGELDSI
ncbi:hypothetical protein XarzCFBP7410_01915 [Xanthomonas arboricola pv. zantedeschiae]|nr:hypothetical protein XarzCFBP7410_01915 [Xanthomonas arboricola pv. zantedeschiae]